MAKEQGILDQVRVAAPCQASWSQMSGDDRVRHCAQCRLNVYNLSDMKREEAEALIRQTEGRLCVRYYQRRDGTILTADCPVGLRWARRRMARLVGGIAAVFVLLFQSVALMGKVGGNGQGTDLQQVRPFSIVCRWFSPARRPPLMGVMAVLPPPSGTPGTSTNSGN